MLTNSAITYSHDIMTNGLTHIYIYLESGGYLTCPYAHNKMWQVASLQHPDTYQFIKEMVTTFPCRERVYRKYAYAHLPNNIDYHSSDSSRWRRAVEILIFVGTNCFRYFRGGFLNNIVVLIRLDAKKQYHLLYFFE